MGNILSNQLSFWFFNKKHRVTDLAVVLVDMQPEFTDNLQEDVFDSIISAQLEIVESCTKFDVPVIVLEFKGCSCTVPELSKPLRSVPRLSVIEKKDDDGFTNRLLSRTLCSYGSKRILLTGINASVCVLKTAKSALRLGFSVHTSEDLIADESDLWVNEQIVDWYANNCVLHEGAPQIQKLIGK